jgi:hypothetical protein
MVSSNILKFYMLPLALIGSSAHDGQAIIYPNPDCLIFFFEKLFFFFYYSYVHTRLGSFLSPAPTPSFTTHSAPSLSPPNTQQKLFCPYF